MTTTTTMTTKSNLPARLILLARAGLIAALLLATLLAKPFPSVGVDCYVDNSYNRYVGVRFEKPLVAGAEVESLTARVITPATAIRIGLTGAQTGDAVTFRNHKNGWWTIELQRTGQSVKLPLFYLAVWGFRPDNDMDDGVIPTEMPGTVTDPALFKKLGVEGMKKGARVVIETDGKNATHLLFASGERRLIP
jgi:hypothetical protein